MNVPEVYFMLRRRDEESILRLFKVEKNGQDSYDVEIFTKYGEWQFYDNISTQTVSAYLLEEQCFVPFSHEVNKEEKINE